MYKSTFILLLFTYNYFVYNFNRSNSTSTSITISVSLYIKYSKLYDYGSDYIHLAKGAYDSDGPVLKHRRPNLARVSVDFI